MVNEKFIASLHEGYIADAKKLMEHEQFNPNYENDNGITHLQTAATINNTEMLDCLYRKGADPKKDGEALCVATAWNNLNSMAWLIEHGADVNASRGLPLREAIYENHREAAQILIANKASVDLAINTIHEQEQGKARKTSDESFQWLRDIENKIELANKLTQNLAEKAPQADSYEAMMKKLGAEHKAKQEQSITRAGRIKM
ncbi:hypothetical protein A8E86_17310 [Burkholderia cenocepacia]|nr:hypothetical protein A8E82_19580 [Burkholderia cenocepacia]ONW01632.1 hypothetical protein A8E86_17310 [Burkholderia cenocepacia]